MIRALFLLLFLRCFVWILGVWLPTHNSKTQYRQSQQGKKNSCTRFTRSSTALGRYEYYKYRKGNVMFINTTSAHTYFCYDPSQNTLDFTWGPYSSFRSWVDTLYYDTAKTPQQPQKVPNLRSSMGAIIRSEIHTKLCLLLDYTLFWQYYYF